MTAKAGDVMMVFDAQSWMPNGDGPDGNAEYWKPALLVRGYLAEGEMVWKVAWADGRVTSGHFESAMRPTYGSED